MGCNVEITRCYTVPRFAIARTIAVFPPADGTLSRRNETLRRGKWSSRRAIDGPVNNGRIVCSECDTCTCGTGGISRNDFFIIGR